MRAARLLTVILILNSLFTSPVLAKNYSDVTSNHKHAQAIADLSERNIIKGYNNGEFHPEGLINRAEAVKILVESKFDDETITRSLDWHKQSNHWYVIFHDVKITDWFGPYVEVSYQNKIIQGYSDGNFHPADNINFAEALKIILMSYGIDTHEIQYKSNPLLYVKKGDWFEPYFTYAYEYNLINQNKFYHPAQLITRGEFAEIVYRLENVTKMKLPEFIVSEQQTSDEYKITIPKLNIIDLQVNFADPHNESAALGVLKQGLGQYLSPPNAGKKTIIFGHSSGYSWDNSPYKTILRRINTLQNGDTIYINYKEIGYIYKIFKSDIIPATEDYRLVENKENNELALYTCWPPDQISYRYVVYGRPVS